MKKRHRRWWTVAALCAAPALAPAQDRADIDRTQIIGNGEKPDVPGKMLGQRALPVVKSERPMASVIDEALAAVDRDVFRRQVRYDTQLASPPPAAAPAAPPAK